MQRTIFIGDVHGCLTELERLLDKLKYVVDDELIFVGDLINKGPDSWGVLQKVKSLQAKSAKVRVIKGNHELKFLEYAKANSKTPRPHFDELLAHMLGQRAEYLGWMRSWPMFLQGQTGNEPWLVVHAGFPPHLDLTSVPDEVLANIRHWSGDPMDMNNPRDPAWYDFYEGEKLVVFGHWALRGLVQRGNVIGLDSGCVYGRELSSLVLPGREIVQVQAEKVYQSIC